VTTAVSNTSAFALQVGLDAPVDELVRALDRELDVLGVPGELDELVTELQELFRDVIQELLELRKSG
jgi:hypothetical protein